METPHTILKRYWNHDQFRPLQEDIVTSVLYGHDTLALLPTGGGKSVCFQVPALLREGVCIVITPLIALMKDQVMQLKRRGIEAVAIHSAMPRQQIDVLLDNCIYGAVKFLYVSPERLHTEIFIERFKQMKVGLIAVDEAHCISQWGYDFRPAYLQIAAVRELKPAVPVIALTATATPDVRSDIMDKLHFGSNAAVFQKSFARDNVSFVVRKAEAKDKKLLEVLQKVKGSAILYVRSRKATQDVATWLSKKGIPATFYHAGLAFEERTRRQDEWIRNTTRVMVATNAFGMGIDKPDVRLVVHLDLPDNLEAYYQEAGRGGRDGQRAFAAIIYHDADVIGLRMKVEQAHPSPEFLRTLYQALANYFQLAVGSGEGQAYDFDLHDFLERFGMHAPEVYVGLRKLEEEGLIQFNESFYSPSQVHLVMDKTRLYQFQVANARFDQAIKTLLRLYGAELFADFVTVSEVVIARGLQVAYAEGVKVLQHLHALQVIIYQPVKDKPQVTFVIPRQDAARLPLDLKRMEARKKLSVDKMNAMIGFAETRHRCRMQLVQDYFGETAPDTCGICDVCIDNRKKDNLAAFQDLRDEVLHVLKNKPATIEQLEELIAPRNPELFVDVVRELVDEGMLQYDAVWKLSVSYRP